MTRLARAVLTRRVGRRALRFARASPHASLAGEGIFDRKAVSAAVQIVLERYRREDHDRYEREFPQGNSLLLY